MRTIISEAEYRKQLDKAPGQAYLFFGEEDYLKAFAVRQTRERLCPDPSFAIFNDITLDALDFSADKLLDAMTPPPMMAEARLIVIRGLDLTRMRTAELDALLETIALLPEYDYNTVILEVPAGLVDEGYLPKRPSAILKKIGEVATPVRFETSTDARLAAWAGKHFAHHGVSASAEVCSFLVSYVGKNMFLLASEIEKLCYYVLSRGERQVGCDHVRLVAVPSVSADAFALSNAILAGRSRDALDALAVLKFERVDPTVVMGELSRTLSDMQAARLFLDAGKTAKEIAEALKLHEYKAGLIAKAVARTDPARLARAIDLAAAADAELKRTRSDYSAIEKLICAL